MHRMTSGNFDQAKLNSIDAFRAGNLACGSGALLSAVYSAILDRHVTASAVQELDANPKELHQALF